MYGVTTEDITNIYGAFARLREENSVILSCFKHYLDILKSSHLLESATGEGYTADIISLITTCKIDVNISWYSHFHSVYINFTLSVSVHVFCTIPNIRMFKYVLFDSL